MVGIIVINAMLQMDAKSWMSWLSQERKSSQACPGQTSLSTMRVTRHAAFLLETLMCVFLTNQPNFASVVLDLNPGNYEDVMILLYESHLEPSPTLSKNHRAVKTK